ncbi:MerR family transcriptional regulator [Seleniivibrio sp.]|uniref:MerR family transcriptional regulator n=1 Tax=Seleniivibrio sp. TaxID=2898801 RepID=UPI0025D2E269|nr:MerR family transcriptional regulator [Seleniivibrio sp.]MCD8554587.1 MerR family transcriptional regulator [Seleniivibrio sp.]
MKIAEVAKMFNCTTEALRFYENEKVVIPERDYRNSYRYYEAQHLKQLVKCAFFRSCGFSVKETIDIMKNGTILDIEDKLKMKEEELQRESKRLLEVSRVLTDYRSKITNIPKKLGTFSICESPEISYLINSYDRKIVCNSELVQLIAKWLHYLPLVHFFMLVKQDELLKDCVWKSYHGYSIDSKFIDQSDFEQRGLTKRLEARKCLYTVQSHGSTQESRLESVRLINKYIKENNYTVNGDMFGCQLFIDKERQLHSNINAGRIYYEYWIPVE